MPFPAAPSGHDAFHLSSLLASFSSVPAAAAPVIIDCVLATSSLPPSQILSSLLEAFPQTTEVTNTNYTLSHFSAICHLIIKSGARDDTYLLFIQRILLPLLKNIKTSDVESISQIIALFCDLVSRTGSWKLMSSGFVPFCLRYIGVCAGVNRYDISAAFQWNPHDFDDKNVGTLPFPIVCRILTSLLQTALRCRMENQGSEEIVDQELKHLDSFVHNLSWELSKMVLGVLIQSSEHRSFSIRVLLPIVVNLLKELSLVTVFVDGTNYNLSRGSLLQDLWECCIPLFSLGHLERLDAYSALSVYFSTFFLAESWDVIAADGSSVLFNILTIKEFWEAIQEGLVDKDSSIRKQALYILKMLLSCYLLPDGKHEHSISTVENSHCILNGEPSHCGLTKRERWADKEARSLGVGESRHLGDHLLDARERWKIFVFLYEMLEEYGQHLVEAAWSHLVSLLFQPCLSSSLNAAAIDFYQVQMGTMETVFSWLTVLWVRGFSHENPQVRCLIMDSFLCIDWVEHGQWARLVPKSFILGSFTKALNDVVHHKDFGVKGIYSSKTIERAAKFFGKFAHEMTLSDGVEFVWSLACLAKADSFCRAGLMALACSIASAASQFDSHSRIQVHNSKGCSCEIKYMNLHQDISLTCNSADILDALGNVIERSKQHFNPDYRLKVCEQVVKAASFLIRIDEIQLNLLLHFFSTVPREFTEFSGPLREMVQQWLTFSAATPIDTELYIINSLTCFPLNFIKHKHSSEALILFDDDDVDAWAAEAQRWARMLLLVAKEEEQLDPIFEFLQNYSSFLCKQGFNIEWAPAKLLILILALVEELQIGWWRRTCLGESGELCVTKDSIDPLSPSTSVYEKSKRSLLPTLDKVVSFAKLASPALWSNPLVKDTQLPPSITGKLGGPSQRRLSSVSTTACLNAILSIRTVASVSAWCSELLEEDIINFSFDFLWNFSWEAIQIPIANSESAAEICLAAYEALASVFKAFSMSFTYLHLNFSLANRQSSTSNGWPLYLFDSLGLSFLRNINNLLANGVLTRSRRAVLMNWKWVCLDSLLSIPYNVNESLKSSYSYFSPSTLRLIALDIIESLENAVENSMLPMLRSVRLVLGLLFSDKSSQLSVSSDEVSQMITQLVESSWILHISCKKRRVAPIAALLSAVLHPSVFSNLSLHETDSCRPGPLKLFIEKLLEDGQKSPRTIRLASLHLTGLWLLYPRTIKYYIKELKLLSLYGSVAFDEDFEAELSENYEARIEVSLLAQSPDPEFAEVFINTEMYARASVSALFYKLASFINNRATLKMQDSVAAVESGKMFLLELLDSAVNEKDLAKELYKKYSGVHRRKVRAWQMICILSRFVEEDIVEEVTHNLHICLYRNNLPAVRQYLEIFAIQIYLSFPSLAEEQLIPIFRDYNTRPQALSSYVFIAANIILHEKETSIRSKHLYELLPPITPLLTSHHHSLRGFTQLLVFHILCKLWPVTAQNDMGVASLEEKCFNHLKSYLAENTDCVRLRSSMEWFLDAFDPSTSSTPSGVFNVHKEGSEFECVPVSLLDQVNDFLNDVREDLRYSIAMDAMTIKNETMGIPDTCQDMIEKPDFSSSCTGRRYPVTHDPSLDFQKKITLNKYLEPLNNTDSQFIPANDEIPRLLSEIEKEDMLFSSGLQARNLALEKIRQSQQQFILVASLIDRIPNLAGLVRTCEIFKAAGLVIADSSILQDRQFQLISVTAEKWVPIIEVPVHNIKLFLEKKRREGFSILGLEQTANSSPLDQFSFPRKTVLVLGREKEGIPADIIHILDSCVEIPQLGIVRSLNVHVSGAIALWEYTRQQRSKLP